MKYINRFTSVCAVTVLTGLVLSCSHSKIAEETPMTEKLGAYKNVVLEATSSEKNGEGFVGDLITMMHKRVTKSKLFDSVGEGTEQMAKADLIIKGDIYGGKFPTTTGGVKLKFLDTKDVILNIRYTIISKKDNKVLGVIVAESDSGGKTSFGAGPMSFSNTDKGYAFGRSCDVLVKYLKSHM